MFRRRQFLIAASGLLASPFANPQPRSEVRRLGFFLDMPKPAQSGPGFLSKRLGSMGWVPKKNLDVHVLWAGEEPTRLPEQLAELVARRMDAIVVYSTQAAVVAARGTNTVPIVLAGASAYPVECGLIKSYARPGTNVTGVAWFQGIGIHAKLAEFVREIVPSAKRLAWIVFPSDLITVSGGEFSPKTYYAKVATSLGFEFSYHECREAKDIGSAFDGFRKRGAQAVIVEPAMMSFVHAKTLVTLAKAARLPVVYGQEQSSLPGGGLLTYSPLTRELHEEAATYVDRIFRGARPSELPVLMPNKLELSVNLQTAKALGITMPPSIIARADRVIE
jgi:putative ABC transport system substrate-binding protein